VKCRDGWKIHLAENGEMWIETKGVDIAIIRQKVNRDKRYDVN
jgi:hypothetical protein